ncbi:hypothetical protein Q7P37_008073 [Cladosporium fusiforme]
MATTANLPFGAIPTNGAAPDPFTSSSANPPSGPTRYASFDDEQFSTFSTSSPSQARRALEAHLKDTDRRIQDASKLGTTLLQQRKNLASKLQEVEELSKDNDVPAELQEKLTALEKEYNDIGRESARAFLPKSKVVSNDGDSSLYSNSGRQSPTKASAPSRRQRNQPSNRVHDIEFATEISTQLLAQVRQLQAALAEKDEEIKEAAASKTRLEDDHANILQRAKLLDEDLQRHRDENWNLETKIQDMETSMRDHADREQRLNQTLKTTQTEKSSAQRELDELKVLHERETDEHATNQRHNEADLHTLRRDAANHDSEKQALHKKIEELNSQNTELAKAVSYRWNQAQSTQNKSNPDKDSDGADDAELDHSDLISPVKGTPARGGLESETLKSSLNHAHRMIQNLKNNIHREKTEKVELKRLLADARDELEKRRDSNAGPAAAIMNRRRGGDPAKGRKQIKIDRLGANRSSTTEIFDEPEWEEHEDPITPSKSLFGRPAPGAAAMPGAFQETDTSDAFETADERKGDTATETEAFQTGAESMGDDSDLTETEGFSKRRVSSISRKSVTPNVPTRPGMPGDRHSYMSTASASADDDDQEDVVRTPVQTQGPKYRLRVNRGLRTSSGPAMNERFEKSPASSMGTPQAVGQSLGDELDALDDDESIEGTPDSRYSVSPTTQRAASVGDGAQGDEHLSSIDSDDDADQTQLSIGSPFTSPVKSRKSPGLRDSIIRKPTMVDSGMMTEPWAPEKEVIVQQVPAGQDKEDSNKVASAVAGAAGGTLAGFGLGRLSKHDIDDDAKDQTAREETSSGDEMPAGLLTPPRRKSRTDRLSVHEPAIPAQIDPIVLQHSTVMAQETQPIATPEKKAVPFQQSSIFSQETEPVAAQIPEKRTVPFQQSTIYSQETEPVAAQLPEKKTIPFQQSTISSQETEPLSPPKPAVKVHAPFQQSEVYTQETEPVSPPTTAIAPTFAATDAEVFQAETPQQLGFSTIAEQDFAPVEGDANTPLLPRRSSKRMDALYAGSADADNDPVRSSAPPGLYGTDSPSLMEDRQRSLESAQTSTSGKDANTIPILTFGGDNDNTSVPERLTEHDRALSNDSMIPITKPLAVKRPMAESGSQTLVSGDEIERMMRDKSKVPVGAGLGLVAGAAAGAAGNSLRRSVDSGMSSTFQPRSAAPTETSSLHGPRQSSSVGNMRSTSSLNPPPLPVDHNKKIAAASHKGSLAPMGPPAVPASAYKLNRPKTPVGQTSSGYRPVSKDGTASRANGRANSGISRQASVSSFASELDERFNIHRGQFPYPDDLPATTDPRMIQAITQTMIGEYLWKYTRKTGRNETSNSRHRRFFWVHPYTRTLYWSESDPSAGSKNMMKAKSMSIEGVRVIADDNTNPPGLHRKSIVVITPGREIVFTAPTGQRHETWFNALSYLLLRSEQERNEADDTINEEDIDEFNPGHGGGSGFANTFTRSISRMTGRSQSARRSVSSYNSQSHSRPSSPTKGANQDSPNLTRPALNSTPTLTRTPHDNFASGRGRFSSLTGKFRNSSQRGSFGTVNSSRPGAQSAMSYRTGGTADAMEGSGIYNASVISDSAEDLRAVIERQEANNDRLENVRSCCDGKHDVGSLNRKGRHPSFTRNQSHHSHSHPRVSTPLKEGSKPRRGE